MRHEIVICADLPAGVAWRDAHGVEGVKYTFVTPRSPDGARGLTADGLHVIGQMKTHHKINALRAICAPALLTKSTK